ncbi:hypothetical protein EFO70_13765 [Lacticaseibacillus rhamnosus]|nr:hypothetical protein [Lacticaseibacillus rhamnosus]MCT3182515.1 hypothetical protein [Lacticaseibacillus rhamnosus]
MASDVMAGPWPLRLRSLHVDFCDCERVLERKPARTRKPPPKKTTTPSLTLLRFKPPNTSLGTPHLQH